MKVLRKKAEATAVIKEFILMVETQFGKKIKVVRSDNAYELGLSKELSMFFKDRGIVHQTSCPHTPQQNGIVERKHRYLLETARAVIFQSSMPLRYWGEGVLFATAIINRLPSSKLKGDNTL